MLDSLKRPFETLLLYTRYIVKNYMKVFLPISLVLFLIVNQSFSQSMKLALEGEEWSGVEEYPVAGRQGIMIKQKLSFGEFHTLVVDRSWTKGSSLSVGLSQGLPTDADYKRIVTSEKIKKKQTLYFTLADSSGNQTGAYCMTDFKSKDFMLGDNPNSIVNIFGDILGVGDESSNFFYARIYDAQGQQAWELLLDNQQAQAKPKTYEGYLSKSKEEYYIIKPLSKVISKKGKTGMMPFGSAGFEIRNKEGKPLAAVSLIDKGVVYLKDMSLEERILLSGALAALLLQEQIGS